NRGQQVVSLPGATRRGRPVDSDGKQNGALMRFQARTRELMRQQGLSLNELERRTGDADASFSRALSGRKVCSITVAKMFDEQLGADGELIALRELAWREDRALRIGLTGTGGALVARQATVEPAGAQQEVSPTDRRELGGLTLVAILATAGDASDAM